MGYVDPEDEGPGAEVIDLVGEPIELRQVAREKFAQRLATRLVSYFGWALVSLVVGGVGLLVLGAAMDAGKETPTASPALMEQYFSILQAVGTFVSSIFGSILGFILGHYFRKEGIG